MGGKGYKRRWCKSRDKYSVEQSAAVTVIPAATATAPSQSGVVVVPPSDTQGMRKVKHIMVSLAMPGNATTLSSIYWALVYVPAGTGVGTLQIGTTGSSTSFYEPNQFVMNCGVADFSAGPCRVSTRLARNLNSGDKIVLIMSNPLSQEVDLHYVVKYAITLH